MLHTLANFITALSLILGGMSTIGLLVGFYVSARTTEGTKLYSESLTVTAVSVLVGILPWSWLIARYLLN